MAAKKKTPAKTSTKKKNTKPTVAEVRQVEEFRMEIVLWIVIACALLLFISNLGIGGVVGNYVSRFLFGIFGLISYIIPILVMIGCFFGISNKGNLLAVIKMAGCVLFFIFFCMLLALIADYPTLMTPTESFTYSFENKAGGGILGGFLAYYIAKAFGLIGAYIISIVMMIISVVLVTGKSAIKGVRAGGRRVAETAKEGNERYREYRKVREQEKARRIDNKVSGVSIDNTKIIAKETAPESALSDEMGELRPKTPVAAASVPEETKTSRVEPKIVGDFLPEETVRVRTQLVPEDAFSGGMADDKDEKNVGLSSEVKAESPMSEIEEETMRTGRRTHASAEEIEEAVDRVADEIIAEETAIPEKTYVFPPKTLLKANDSRRGGNTQYQLRETASKLEQTLRTFGVNVNVTDISCGPAVTRYEIQPEMGVKVSRIVNLADDIKLNLAAEDIRIEAPIPGKAAVGIEVPNKEKSMVSFRELIESEEFNNNKSKIAFAVGKDISGQIRIADIAKMPHVLIAGATGSGKSVCINTIIMSILFKADPKDVKLIMIDPKVVELSVYNGIPHLMIPVVTDPKKAAGALHWAVAEMTERYNRFAEMGVRDIEGYNTRIKNLKVPEGQEAPKRMPQIVIIVDELADLMMVASADVEEAICRLAQLARACGIHLVIATQRPSVNVITGLIKANMPSRIAFAVTSGVDSRTILDMNGAEKLLGKGDMLFHPQGVPKPIRVQGAFVSDREVADVVRFLAEHNGNVAYSEEVQKRLESLENSANTTVSISDGDTAGDGRDAYFMEAAKIIIDKEKASIGMLQRYLKVGFNRAARIMDQLEEAGIVGPEEGTKPRKVLMGPEEFEQYMEEY